METTTATQHDILEMENPYAHPKTSETGQNGYSKVLPCDYRVMNKQGQLVGEYLNRDIEAYDCYVNDEYQCTVHLRHMRPYVKYHKTHDEYLMERALIVNPSLRKYKPEEITFIKVCDIP